MAIVTERQCKECGGITSNLMFCSRSCSATNSNRANPKRKKTFAVRIRPCMYCGTELLRDERLERVFCGSQCRWSLQQQELKAAWLEGLVTPLSICSFIRPNLRAVYGDICWGCGFDKQHPDGSGVPLQLDHVDGNRRNNHIDNLKLLCGACHSLTPTWGGRNTAAQRSLLPVV